MTTNMRWRWVIVVSLVGLVAAACGTSDDSGDDGGDDGGTDVAVVDSIGDTEGELNLIAWNGYVEDGSVDKNYDWVTPFEDETGCKVSVKYADTSDEMVTLMRQGGTYDGVSASGDASNRLIAGGNVSAIDPSLFSEFENVIGPLQVDGSNNAHYVVDGKVYGTPYMYGPNFLMYNTDVVKPAPTSWDITWEADSPYAGKLTAYDAPIFIADAAMYLMATQPDLGITDPYDLTQEQLDAATNLLKQQSEMVAKYWALYTDEIDGFLDGSMVAGTAWPINLTYAKADTPAAAVIPDEGVTGWADTWMLNSEAEHPNCMLKWMEWSFRPEIQAEVAIWYGAAASNVNGCDEIVKQYGKGGEKIIDTVEYGFCGNEEFLDSIYLWKTPDAVCNDGSSGCVDYTAWQQAWTEVKG